MWGDKRVVCYGESTGPCLIKQRVGEVSGLGGLGVRWMCVGGQAGCVLWREYGSMPDKIRGWVRRVIIEGGVGG